MDKWTATWQTLWFGELPPILPDDVPATFDYAGRKRRLPKASCPITWS
jgi:hypothetical protein